MGAGGRGIASISSRLPKDADAADLRTTLNSQGLESSMALHVLQASHPWCRWDHTHVGGTVMLSLETCVLSLSWLLFYIDKMGKLVAAALCTSDEEKMHCW